MPQLERSLLQPSHPGWITSLATAGADGSRSFLCRLLTAGVAAFTAPAVAVLRAENRGDTLRISVIGCGGRGAANLVGVAAEQVVRLTCPP